MNQDGRTQGLSMPNGKAQADLIRSVYQSAGLDVNDTGYVEAHGTGTKVGDPIEASALHSVFGEGRSPKEPLYVGSIKSNIGHAEGSSGILAIIKTALMLEKGFILPNIHFKKPNEAIPLAKWNMKVCCRWSSHRARSHIQVQSLTNFRYRKRNYHGHVRRSMPASITSVSVVRTVTSYLKAHQSLPRMNVLLPAKRRLLSL